MSDLISRQAAIDALTTAVPTTLYDALRIIEKLPSAEKRGRWIKDGDTYSLYKCSSCNDFCTVVGYANCISEERMYKTMKFCPNCGARMDFPDNNVGDQI